MTARISLSYGMGRGCTIRAVLTASHRRSFLASYGCKYEWYRGRTREFTRNNSACCSTAAAWLTRELCPSGHAHREGLQESVRSLRFSWFFLETIHARQSVIDFVSV